MGAVRRVPDHLQVEWKRNARVAHTKGVHVDLQQGSMAATQVVFDDSLEMIGNLHRSPNEAAYDKKEYRFSLCDVRRPSPTRSNVPSPPLANPCAVVQSVGAALGSGPREKVPQGPGSRRRQPCAVLGRHTRRKERDIRTRDRFVQDRDGCDERLPAAWMATHPSAAISLAE